MQFAPPPPDELDRLAALHDLHVMYSAPETEFDALVEAASVICGVPMALIGLIDDTRQWYKAQVGMGDRTEVPRTLSFCTHTLLQREVLEIPDAREDARFFDHPGVAGDPHVRFYAGVAIRVKEGHAAGTLCVIDHAPRTLAPAQRIALECLARVAGQMLDGRRALQVEHALRIESERGHLFLQHSADAIVGVSSERHVTQWNAAAAQLFGYDTASALGCHMDTLLLVPQANSAPAAHVSGPADLSKSSNYEAIALHRDGQQIPVSVTWVANLDARGGVGGAIKFIRDLRVLHERETQLRRLYDETPAMLHSIDLQGRIVDVSKRWLEEMGYVRTEVIGVQSTRFMTPASQDHARNTVLPEFFRSGHCHQVNYQMVRKDGSVMDVLLSAYLERDGSGQPARSLAIMEDITARRRAERLLQESEARYRLLVEDQSELVTLFDTDGVIRFVNAAYGRFYGSVADSLTGRTVFELLEPDERARARSLFDQVLETDGPCASERSARNAAGEWRRIAWNLRPSRDAEGAITGIHAVGRDVTDRFRLEEQLGLALSEVEDLYESAPCAYYSLDRQGRFLRANQTALQWLGSRRADLIGQCTPYEFLTEASRRVFAEHLRTLLWTSELNGIELELVPAQEVRRWVSANASVVRDADGSIQQFRMVLVDITQRKHAELAMLQLTREQSAILESGLFGACKVRDRQIGWANRGLETMLGYGPGELTGMPARVLHPTDESFNRLATFSYPLLSQGQQCRAEMELQTKEGGRVWIDLSGTLLDASTGEVLWLSFEITARKRAEQQLISSQSLLAATYERQRVTLESIGDAVITTNCDGAIEWLNPAAERLTGWRRAEAQGLPVPQVFQIVHQLTRAPLEDLVSRCMQELQVIEGSSQSVLVSRTGQEFAIEESAAPIRDANGVLHGAVLVFHDDSAARRLSQEMRHRASHDALTGLVNRTEFEARLQQLLEQVKAGDGQVHSVMYVDLDQFKVVNDTCGHAVGDQLLRQVSAMLRDAVRSRDMLARLGGDEFGMILEQCSAEQASRIGQKLCGQMETYRFVHEEHRFRIGTSIGLVEMDSTWDSVSELQKAADSACYRAKQGGRNRVQRWFNSDDLMQARHGETSWINRLERAMDDQQFLLFGQRIQPLASAHGQNSGLHCEVLLRLPDGHGGLIPPATFFPAAERSGIAARLDRWVVQQVFARLQHLGDQLESVELLSINLSGQSITDQTFCDHLILMVREAGFDVRKLCFEITETAAITNILEARPFIEALRGLGVRIALDDFGAGVSSFAYLKRLPVDFLKIDGQFITHMLQDPLDQMAVQCFHQVAEVMGVRTIAEFVECAEVRDHLVQIGVDFAQGYLIHRPEPLWGLFAAPAAPG